MEEIIKAVKGFNPDMTCTPTNCIKFQYEEGETYEEKEVDVCKKDFMLVNFRLMSFDTIRLQKVFIIRWKCQEK